MVLDPQNTKRVHLGTKAAVRRSARTRVGYVRNAKRMAALSFAAGALATVGGWSSPPDPPLLLAEPPTAQAVRAAGRPGPPNGFWADRIKCARRQRLLMEESVTDTSETRPADSAGQASEQSTLAPPDALHLIAPVLLWAVPCWVCCTRASTGPSRHAGRHRAVRRRTDHDAARDGAQGTADGSRTGRRSSVTPCWVRAGSCSPGPCCSASAAPGPERGRSSATAERARIVTWAVLGVAVVLLAWGTFEARRVPRVRRLDVQLPSGRRIGRHPGRPDHRHPLRAARPRPLVERVCETVNSLEADLVCHTGDIADGTAERRRAQSDRWVRCRPPTPGSTSPGTTSTTARPRAGST